MGTRFESEASQHYIKHECVGGLTGVRHSRRLAALAEAEPLPPARAQTQQTSDRKAVCAQRSMHHQGPKSIEAPSPVLLGAATLEASANVLKGLVSNIRLQLQ